MRVGFPDAQQRLGHMYCVAWEQAESHDPCLREIGWLRLAAICSKYDGMFQRRPARLPFDRARPWEMVDATMTNSPMLVRRYEECGQ